MKRPFLRILSGKTGLLWILIGWVGGLCLPVEGISQAPKTYHQVEIYMPFYNFMDGAPLKGVYSIGQKAQAQGKGIRYSFSFNRRHSLSVSTSKFYASYHSDGPVAPGEMHSRYFKLLNVDYRFRLLDRPRWGVDVFAGISRRRGAESVAFAYPKWFLCDDYVEDHPLNDWGARMGLHAEYRFWKQFQLSLEGNYTWYFHRYDRGLPTDVLQNGTSIHQMAMQLGLDYTFDKCFFTKGFWWKRDRRE